MLSIRDYYIFTIISYKLISLFLGRITTNVFIIVDIENAYY